MPGTMLAMIDLETAVAALQSYRKRLLLLGQPLKAAAVTHCISILRRLVQ